MTSVKLELPVKIEKEGNLFVAICEPFNIASQGSSKEIALENIREALELFLSDEDVLEMYQDLISSYTVPEKEEHVSVKIDGWQKRKTVRSEAL
ncbi:type II toxin-antitoxin system HicB family antitoxin [Methanothermobacter sp.]|uniref:type II toxin-antitoxin system HicB family antitoxin n=1 Tax=Methanothermobacter sp. TaxID=1884223 RepID=UPI00262A147E|nr:type II toxin-antitoxin system HicB family antitoxin [Methanothermobacter sp.]MDI9615079.1 type II toxin-antitoxin system HicB family antitoxin [Methanothermobacter sp.]MDI9617681.1 type II toxin-antitoxin system HicB family antitoxin [Methanothermobacter sp.]